MTISSPPTSRVDAGLVVQGLESALAGPFDLSIPPGGLLAISGASGSGKSLFLRMIADLDPNQGEVTLNGAARSGLAADEWRRRTPYVAAESGWWTDMAADHFDPKDRPRAQALAERLGVGREPFEGRVDRLSTGERQRLALVRGFMLNSPALLLDEPTGPLDPVSVEKVEELLKERAAAGAIIILASHDPHQGLRLGARRLRMADRRLGEDL
jgi:ABC-type lipoprotein export system ATPase subunit